MLPGVVTPQEFFRYDGLVWEYPREYLHLLWTALRHSKLGSADDWGRTGIRFLREILFPSQTGEIIVP